MQSFLEYLKESALILDSEMLNEVAIVPNPQQNDHDNILVLVGGPGSGKSYIMNELFDFQAGYLNPDTHKEAMADLIMKIKKEIFTKCGVGREVKNSEGKILDYADIPGVDIDDQAAKKYPKVKAVLDNYVGKYNILGKFIETFHKKEFCKGPDGELHFSKEYPKLPAMVRSIMTFNLHFNPIDGTFVHMFMAGRNRNDASAGVSKVENHEDNMLAAAGEIPPGEKPNIVFDVSGKKMSFFTDRLRKLARIGGYRPENIHIAWVLTRLDVAINNNNSRSRRMFEDDVIEIHVKVARTITKLIKMNPEKRKKFFDGNFYIIFNASNDAATVDDNGKMKIVNIRDVQLDYDKKLGMRGQREKDAVNPEARNSRALYFQIKKQGENFSWDRNSENMNSAKDAQAFLQKLATYVPDQNYYSRYSKGTVAKHKGVPVARTKVDIDLIPGLKDDE